MPFIPSPLQRPEMGQGPGPSARPVGSFGQGLRSMPPKGEASAGMPPINMPSNYPPWQQPSMNGMQEGQLAMHGTPMNNGGPISTGALGVSGWLCSHFTIGSSVALLIHG